MSTININRTNRLRDLTNLVIFIAAVVIGTLIVNAFVFRSYTVVGASMEDTLHDGERIIVNRLPNTWAQIQNTDYVPSRGDIIVFQNPRSTGNSERDKYLVKRVIAFAGERVVVKDSQITVYNNEHPEGFHPDEALKDTPRSPTSGEVDTVVPAKTVFVAGDHRDGSNSFDSRNGLGTVPIYDIIGPVILRWWPLDKFRAF